MKIFKLLTCCVLLSATLNAQFPSSQDLSSPSARGSQGGWVAFASEETSANISFYAQLTSSRSRIYFELEYDAVNETGQVRTTNALFTIDTSRKTLSGRESGQRNRTRASLGNIPGQNKHISISTDGNMLNLVISDIRDSGHAEEQSNVSIDLTKQESRRAYQLLASGETVVRWKRYTIYASTSSSYSSSYGWLETTPESSHPVISSVPFPVDAFLTAAAEYRASLTNMSDEALLALTEDDVRAALPYAELPEEARSEADAVIADILRFAHSAGSTEWDNRKAQWEQQEDGSHKAGHLETGCYAFNMNTGYDMEVPAAALSHETATDEYNRTWFYDAQAGGPTSTIAGSWDAQSIGLASTLSTAYDAAALTAGTWSYTPATMNWEHSASGMSWQRERSTGVWTQTVTESDCASSESFEWTFNYLAQTWTNNTTGDVWHNSEGGTWERVDSTECWVNSDNDQWHRSENPAVIFTPVSCGAWGQASSAENAQDGIFDVIWTWNTSVDSQRGIWGKKNVVTGTLDLCSYDEAGQRWDNSGTTEHPPVLLPPFVATVQSDIIAAHKSLRDQGVL